MTQLTDDERAALGRYRVGSDLVENPKTTRQQLHTIWPEPDDYDGDDPWSWVYGMDADQEILADLALREHPADVGDEIDAPWIDQLCVDVLRGKHAASWRGIHHDDGSTSFIMNAHRCDSAASCSGVPVTTRGDVYRVLRALGIEVKG